jgi:hypothetical protein
MCFVKVGQPAMLHSDSEAHSYYSGDEDSATEEEGGDDVAIDETSVNHLFRDETWNQIHSTFDPPLREFIGARSPLRHFHHFSSFMMLWEFFWPGHVMHRIVRETNRYAMERDANGNTCRGTSWVEFTVAELKAFIACTMLIGLKRQLNRKTYWNKRGLFYQCPVILHIFTRERFQALTNCLHLTPPDAYVQDRNAHGYKIYYCGRDDDWLQGELLSR